MTEVVERFRDEKENLHVPPCEKVAAAMPDAKRRSKCPVMGLYYFLILNLFLPVRGLATGFLQLRSSSASLFGGNHAAAKFRSPALRCSGRSSREHREVDRLFALPAMQTHRHCPPPAGGGDRCAHRRERLRISAPPRLCAAHTEEEQLLPAGENGKPVLILGAGWVGSRLALSLQADDVPVVVTNRPGTDLQAKPPYFRPVELSCPPFKRVEFDITEPTTWDNLPDPESLAAAVVTFPCATGSAEPFWDAYLSRVPKGGVQCFSTTSVYRVDVPGQDVNEATPLKATPRCLGEEYMRERGATCLTISGIFGDQRTPRAICTCLSTYTTAGGALNGRKRINMVHVDDIVKASRTILAKPLPSERINVAGSNFSLEELVQHCKHPSVPDGPDTDLASKCVCSQRLLTEVMPNHEFIQPIKAKSAAAAPAPAQAS